MTASGRVTHVETEGVHVLCYFGRVNYLLAPAIKRFTDEVIDGGNVRGWVFDLTRAEILDSTNLGLMVRIAHRSGSDAPTRSVIVSTQEDINRVLHSMGFDETFEIVSAPPIDHGAGEADDIDGRPSSSREIGEIMLDAHRTLMTLSETGRLQFADVVACLEADQAQGR
jgi:anti-anti-sigma factor